MNYEKYKLSAREILFYGLCYGVLDALISWLFYQSFFVFFLFFPGVLFFFQEVKKELRQKQKKKLERGFLTGMRYVSTALAAGYSVENAFAEALQELDKISVEGEPALKEYQSIVNGLAVNMTLEQLLMDLARRSHIEDIRTFAEVFTAAKRTGGDLIAIIRSTIVSIAQKEETEQEIEVVLTAKRMEQNIMSLIPCLLIGYVSLTSPGFFNCMYGNLSGILVMSVCLAIYVAAVLLGRRIVKIEV